MKYLLYIVFVILITSSCKNDNQIKIIAYNVEYGRNTTPEKVAKLLEEYNADVICFNEVPIKGWSKRVGNLLKLNYEYESKIASANHSHNYQDSTKNYYGKYKSIISKYPLINKEEILIDGYGWGPASAVIADIQISLNNNIKIFSLHVPSGLNDPINSKAKVLTNILKRNYQKNERIVVAGDFNDLYDSMPLSFFYSINFNNSWKALNMDMSEKTTWIYANKPEDTVIDHIFFKGLEIEDAGIIEENENYQSDHKPIWSQFKTK